LVDYLLLGKITWAAGNGVFGFEPIPDPSNRVAFDSQSQYLMDRLDFEATSDVAVSSGRQGFIFQSLSDFYQLGESPSFSVEAGNVRSINWYKDGELLPQSAGTSTKRVLVANYSEGFSPPVSRTTPSDFWYRSTLSLNSLTLSSPGFYYANGVSANAGSYSVSDLIQVSIPDPQPLIVKQPVSKVVQRAGTQVTLEVDLKCNSKALLDTPRGLAVAPDGDFYVVESGNNSLRKATLGGFVNTMIGSKKAILDPNADGVSRDSIWGMASGIAVRVGSLISSDKLLISSRLKTAAINRIKSAPWALASKI
jgi:hypothetical protein